MKESVKDNPIHARPSHAEVLARASLKRWQGYVRV